MYITVTGCALPSIIVQVKIKEAIIMQAVPATGVTFRVTSQETAAAKLGSLPASTESTLEINRSNQADFGIELQTDTPIEIQTNQLAAFSTAISDASNGADVTVAAEVATA